MIEIRNLTINVTRDLRTIIEGLSFTINKGDRAVIIGEEGNGKSTLLKLIYDEKLTDGYVSYEGSINRNNALIGYLPQELSEADKALPISEYVRKYQLHNNVRFDMPPEIVSAASELELPSNILSFERPLGSLSGGERVKLLLMLLQLSHYDVILLDEPSNDIDIETLVKLEDFIINSTVPVMFVSHDETLIRGAANMIIHIEQLRDKTRPRSGVYRMTYDEYYESRLRGMENQARVAGSERKALAKKQERWQKIYNAVHFAQNNVLRAAPSTGRLLKKKMHSVKAQGRRIEKERENLTDFPETEEAILPDFKENVAFPNGKILLELNLPQLLTIDGKRELSRNIKLNLTGPKKTFIIGKNGCGKSTLIKIVVDELLGRKDINTAYMSQNYADMLDLSLTPVDILAESGTKEDITIARTYLGAMKFTRNEMLHKAFELSEGQKAKLYLIKILLGGYNVLILDEPTRNLSPLSGPSVRRLLSDFEGAIIAVSHDRMLINEVADTVFKLDETGLTEIY